MRRWIAILLASVLLTALAACSVKNVSDKTLTSKGVSITLPDGYHVYTGNALENNDTILTGFVSKDGNVAIYVISEDGASMAVGSDFTADDYLQAQSEYSTGQVTTKIEEKDGVKFYTYTYTTLQDQETITLKYLNTAYRNGSQYYLVQFCCEQENFDKMQDDFIQWAKTVTFEQL